MNVTAATATRSNSRALIITILGALALLALWFIAKRATPYLEMSPNHYGPYFWPRRWGLVLHVAGGVIALTAGVVQLWLGLTNRVAALHRALGKLYVGVIAVGSVAGFYLALTIHGNVPYGAGLFFLCVAWVITTAMAVLAIRRRDLLQHREWMMRSYAVTFAFVTFRIGVDVLTSRGLAPSDAQAVMAWACWAVPLLLLEPLLQLRRAVTSAPSPASRWRAR
jgi:uncharacterized membrane protein